jgi:hypothetical protein
VKIFLSLEAETRAKAFTAYKESFGEKKAEYLRRVYANWQSGSVKISKDMQERLLRFLPPLLSFQDKYKIIEALWNGSQRQDVWHLSLSTRSQIADTIRGVQGRLKLSREVGFPNEIANAVGWLANGDAEIAVQMIERFGQEEDRQFAVILAANLASLHEFLCRNESAGTVYHELNTPGLRIIIQMQREDKMSDAERHLSVRSDAHSGSVARIQNPSDLLGEALRQLSPEQASEILGKAAHASLTLQIKGKEAELDLAIAQRKLENMSATARNLSATGGEFHLEGEHRNDNGYTRVTVTKEQKRGFLSWLLG